MEQKIIDFLNEQSCVRSTAYIAKYCIYEDEYLCEGMQANKTHVSGAYYRLNKLAKQNKIKYVPRGMWKKLN